MLTQVLRRIVENLSPSLRELSPVSLWKNGEALVLVCKDADDPELARKIEHHWTLGPDDLPPRLSRFFPRITWESSPCVLDLAKLSDLS